MEKKIISSTDFIYYEDNNTWKGINTTIKLDWVFSYYGISKPDMKYTTFARYRVDDTEIEFRHYTQNKITITLTKYYEQKIQTQD